LKGKEYVQPLWQDFSEQNHEKDKKKGLWNFVKATFCVEVRRRTGLGLSPVTDTGMNVISQLALPENWLIIEK
jgi:hypothetical protein